MIAKELMSSIKPPGRQTWGSPNRVPLFGFLSLLLGCKELKVLNGFNAIIERDSFSAIQWGSTSLIYPWRMADWV